jgi:hypothetical protein
MKFGYCHLKKRRSDSVIISASRSISKCCSTLSALLTASFDVNGRVLFLREFSSSSNITWYILVRPWNDMEPSPTTSKFAGRLGADSEQVSTLSEKVSVRGVETKSIVRNAASRSAGEACWRRVTNPSNQATRFCSRTTWSCDAGRRLRSTCRYSQLTNAFWQVWHGTVLEHFSYNQSTFEFWIVRCK